MFSWIHPIGYHCSKPQVCIYSIIIYIVLLYFQILHIQYDYISTEMWTSTVLENMQYPLHQLQMPCCQKLDSNLPLTGKEQSPTTVTACVCVCVGVCWRVLVCMWVLVYIGEWRCL